MYKCVVGLCMPGAQEGKRRVLELNLKMWKSNSFCCFVLRLGCLGFLLLMVVVVVCGLFVCCCFFGLVCICFEIGAHYELVRLARLAPRSWQCCDSATIPTGVN